MNINPKTGIRFGVVRSDSKLLNSEKVFDVVTYGVRIDGDKTDSHYDENGSYMYQGEGYKVVLYKDGSLFIEDSPYYTMCGENGASSPNAGNIFVEGSHKTYCLGPEWFENDEAPYNVLNVKENNV